MSNSVSIAVTDQGITISLPPADQTVVPTIPAELREDVPAFVVEWVLEADEIATVVQELLQAPTRSLCRAMAAPNAGQGSTPTFRVDPLTGRPTPTFRSPTPPILRAGGFEVQGYADTSERIPGLPEGVMLPDRLLEILAMSRKVDAWISKGNRVTEWAYEQGKADLSWMPATGR